MSSLRPLQVLDLASEELTVGNLEKRLEFDDRAIDFDYEALLDASPFVKRI